MKKQLIYTLILTVGFFACQNKQNPTSPSNSVESDKNTLDVATAKAYVKNYAKRARTIDSVYNDEKSGKKRVEKLENTRAVWFGIDQLKTLISKIEAEGGDGIRFYFAAYDSIYKDDNAAHQPIKAYWNRNTLIMVSTKDSLKQYHRDYYEKANDTKEAGFIVKALPENRGEMCPPPSDCNGTGATLIER